MTSHDQCIGRFAPSPTGPAHPGTLLSGLLAWLDARQNHARFILRLEDIDPDRAKPEWSAALLRDLEWFGLDWDEVVIQTTNATAHHSALDQLSDQDLLYGCTCTRAQLKRTATFAADGSRKYPGTCRERQLTRATWRAFDGAIRLRLPEKTYLMRHMDGIGRMMQPSTEMGDPVVRRKDGAVAYHLAVVADDIASGVTRIVRGRDLLFATGIHLALYEALGASPPAYFHHFLLMERRVDSSGIPQKLAKLHGSISAALLRRHLSPEALCGILAACAGLTTDARPVTPQDLLHIYEPRNITQSDQHMSWHEKRLEYGVCK